MKTMRKALALIMALAIVMSLGITAFAAAPAAADGKIVITDVQNDKVKYNVYCVFDLVGKNGDNYTYKVNTNWLTYFQEAGALADYVTLTQHGSDYYVAQKGNSETWAKDLAKAISAIDPKPAADVANKTAESGQNYVEITDLPLGYYFIDTTSGTLCSLDTNDASAQIKDKNPPLTVEKEIVDSDVSTVKSTQTVGEEVPFKVTFTVKDGAVDYVLKDVMTDGMTLVVKNADNYVNGIKISVDGTAVETAQQSTVATSTHTTTSFDLTFDNDWLAANAGKVVTVEYNGLVTATIVTTKPSTNSVKVEYGKPGSDGNKLTTNEAKTETFSFDIPVVKYFKDGQLNKPLEGASFELRTTESQSETAIKFSKSGNTYTPDKDNGSATITTDATGRFTVHGLKAGTYYLVETVAPDGYQLAPSKTIVIGESGLTGTENITLDGTQEEITGVIAVENIAGSRLPVTGGMGTTLFYVVGSLMMVSALVLLITKKKMSVN